MHKIREIPVSPLKGTGVCTILISGKKLRSYAFVPGRNREGAGSVERTR